MGTIKNDGMIRYLGLLNQEHVLLTSPQALSEVYVTNTYDYIKTPQFRNHFGRIICDGLVLAEGEPHRYQRKHLSAAFAFRHIKELYPLFWQKAGEGVHAILKEIPENSNARSESAGRTGFIEASEWASRIGLDIIGIAALGRDFGAIQDPTGLLFQTYGKVFSPHRHTQLLAKLALIFPAWLVHALPLQRNAELKEAIGILRNSCTNLVREKEAKLARKELKDIDILSVAVESGAFTEKELVDQLMTFLAAGHEPTVITMLWAVYCLACHPEVQDRLRHEVREHIPSLDSPITSVQIDRMHYLHAVISEVLRLYTAVPVINRDACVDTTILGVRIPRGTRVVVSNRATNRDPKLWGPDAHDFNPDRWVPRYDGDQRAALGGATSNMAFMSFIQGPRLCLGMRFARAELACMLAAFVGKMEFSLRYPEEMDESKFDLKSVVTGRPAGGINVKVKVLDGW